MVQVSGQSATFSGQVSDVGTTPLSVSEASTELNSDYLLNTLITAEYSVQAHITVSQTGIADGTILNLIIIVEQKKPFDFLGS